MPGEKEFSEKLTEISVNENEIEKEKFEVEKNMYKLDLLKSLLYEKGKYTLEPAVREAFKIIGFSVLDHDDYKEEYDLHIKEDDLLIIGEIEGSENQIDVRKFRQLLDYVISATDSKNVKGLLIGNGFLNEEPSDRQEQFTERAIKGCAGQKICMITTFELFKTVKKILEGSENEELKNKIKKSILECDGKFLFDNLNV